jgi:NAD-dependent deacetylase
VPTTTSPESSIESLASLLRAAERVFALCGAGMSTASKIPDYRGPAGLYRSKRPVYHDEFVRSDDKRREYWQFKLDGYEGFRDAEPNPAHRALVELERLGKLGLLVTQNVDGLHQRAGTSKARLVELHGTNAFARCDACRAEEPIDRAMRDFASHRSPPLCPACGGFMRPSVVMFGEMLDQSALGRAVAASRTADLVLSLGSSLVVTPAADLPLYGARAGAPYVVVNQGETPHDAIATLKIDDDVSEVLPAALALLTSTYSETRIR